MSAVSYRDWTVNCLNIQFRCYIDCKVRNSDKIMFSSISQWGSTGVQQLVAARSDASCQKTCCKLIAKTCYPCTSLLQVGSPYKK